jgi:hypothetical protein
VARAEVRGACGGDLIRESRHGPAEAVKYPEPR